MKLRNRFSQKTKNLYLYRHDCDICGQNGQDCGGLDLHHITGRRSSSPLNASLLCKRDHSHIGHTRDEEQKLFARNLEFLLNQKYKITPKDEEFMRKHPYLIQNPYLWISSVDNYNSTSIM